MWGRLEGRGFVTYTLDGRRCETEYAAVQHTEVCLQRLGLRDAAAAQAAAAAAADAAGASAAGPAREGSAPAADASGSRSGSAGTSPSSTAVWVTTVDLWPHTGRRHQLRRHMALIGHPLVGEPRYSFGYAQQRLLSGQAMPAEDHRRLPADVAVGAGAGAAAAAAAPQPQPDPLGPELAGLRLASARAEQQHAFPLCLWALELRLESHPATGEPLHLQTSEPPLFADVRAALAAEVQ